MEEIWKDIQGYEGVYQVSNTGNVRSLDRVIAVKNGTRKLRGVVLSPRNISGYLQVILYNNKKQENHYIHRLVATQFLPIIPGKEVVNHLNGIKTDNAVTNLEWCDPKSNQQHQIAMGLKVVEKGENAPNFRGAIHVFSADGELVDILVGKQDMVAKGYSQSQVSAVLNGNAKTHKGCTFRRVS